MLKYRREGVGNNFLNKTSEITNYFLKSDKMDNIKIKNVWTFKDAEKQRKDKPQTKEISAMQMAIKVCMCTCRELLQVNRIEKTWF